MTDSVFESLKHPPQARRLTEGWNTLRTKHASGLIARIEAAFVSWQQARLETLSPERLWAPAMQDVRSFAEIRRARDAAPR